MKPYGSIYIKNENVALMKKILNQSYAVGTGEETKRIVRELKRAAIPVHHGYCQDTKKVIIVLPKPVKIDNVQRSLNKTMFKLRLKL